MDLTYRDPHWTLCSVDLDGDYAAADDDGPSVGSAVSSAIPRGSVGNELAIANASADKLAVDHIHSVHLTDAVMLRPMPTRTRWARAVIAAGSLASLIAIIIVAYVFLPTGIAGLISLVSGVGWAMAMVLAWVTWCTHPDGSRKMRLPLAATVVGGLAAVMVSSQAPDALLARIGRPAQATVVAERLDELGGSGAYRYTLQDSNGRQIPGEIRDSFDTHDVGDSVWVLTDPRGIITTDSVPLVESQRWRPVTDVFTGAAITLGVVAMLLCFFAGYLASGPYALRTIRRVRLSK